MNKYTHICYNTHHHNPNWTHGGHYSSNIDKNEYLKRWTELNKDKKKAYDKKYREKNAEKIQLKAKEKRKENKERLKYNEKETIILV